MALFLGVEIHENVTFDRLIPPPEDQSISKFASSTWIKNIFEWLGLWYVEEIGWKAKVSPADHPVSQYEFDVLIGADGKRNTLEGNIRFLWIASSL